MYLINARVLDGDFQFQNLDVEVDDGRIVRMAKKLDVPEEALAVDCAGYTVVPGFVDIHVHGGAGADACDADANGLKDMARYLLTKGVTSFCPTTMTLPEDRLCAALRTIRDTMGENEGARIVGVNLEGPFISREKKGAQGDSFIHKPDIDLFRRLNEAAGGNIRLADVAPECDDSGFIAAASKLCTVSLAHTAADYETAMEAFRRGATHATHLFNAMTGFTHRAPGVVGAVFDAPNVCAELICDGIHVHPAAVRTAFRLMPERICVISDAMRLSGMGDGEGALGENTVTVRNGRATLPDGTIAGSVTNLHDELKNLIRWGVPPETALRAMTLTPAKQIGMDAEIGSLEPGKRADLVVLDENWEIVAVYR